MQIFHWVRGLLMESLPNFWAYNLWGYNPQIWALRCCALPTTMNFSFNNNYVFIWFSIIHQLFLSMSNLT
jgi:hypothetical protein